MVMAGHWRAGTASCASVSSVGDISSITPRTKKALVAAAGGDDVPCPLCGDGEPAVFDKAAVVDQVEDVLAGGPAAGVVPTLNGVRPGGVLGERYPFT